MLLQAQSIGFTVVLAQRGDEAVSSMRACFVTP
jgi:hypothetical protein